MSKIKNGGLDQYGAGPFEQQQFGTAGVEGVNIQSTSGLYCSVNPHAVTASFVCPILLALLQVLPIPAVFVFENVVLILKI